jgi:hypothetical protein
MKYAVHNHAPLIDPSACYQHRQLNADQKECVIQQHQANVAPRLIIKNLRDMDDDLYLKKRDLYNIRAEVQRLRWRGQAPTDAFVNRMNELKAEKIYFAWEPTSDTDNRIKHMIIADMRLIHYLRQNPDVMILDCTYETNKFDMPLLDALGIDCMGQGFGICVAFLDNETSEDSYDWALEHIRKLYRKTIPSVIATDCQESLMKAVAKHFPSSNHVLCFWHVCKNLLTNNKSKFETAERWEKFLREFRDVVYSRNEEEFEARLKEFKEEFHWCNGQIFVSPDDGAEEEVTEKNLERSAVEYTLADWLGKYKEKVVHAWVDQFFHCGTTTTSR